MPSTVATVGPFRVKLDTGDAQFPVLAVRCIERGVNTDTEFLIFDGSICAWVLMGRVRGVEAVR